jgi:hypothetical protein
MMQFGLQFRRPDAPEISQDEVDRVVGYLKGQGWVKGGTIMAALDLDERRIRAIAEASDGLIISGPGSPGYRLLTGAGDLREVDEAANRLESQANRMLLRAESLRRRARTLQSHAGSL